MPNAYLTQISWCRGGPTAGAGFIGSEDTAIVKKNGLPVSDHKVLIYNREHGDFLVGWKRTNDVGGAAFLDLNPNLEYNIVAISSDRSFNDQILARVKPTPYEISVEGGFQWLEDDTISSVTITGGYQVTADVVDGVLPPGASLVVNGHVVSLEVGEDSGSIDTEDWEFTVRFVSSRRPDYVLEKTFSLDRKNSTGNCRVREGSEMVVDIVLDE